jgi:hypothetical protein
MDLVDVDAAEVHTLRQEITTRISLMNALVALELAAVGTGLTLIGSATYVLAGLAAISSFLWLLWMDQSIQTFKIAAYLAVDVAPRLRRLAGRRLLEWEYFVRMLDGGRGGSERALHRGAASPDGGIVRPFRADWYAPVLFGATPPILLASYVVTAVHRDTEAAQVVLACAAGGLLWIFAVSRFADFVHNSRVITRAIVGARADDPPAAVPESVPETVPDAVVADARPDARGV